jgi:hypothetical protein
MRRIYNPLQYEFLQPTAALERDHHRRRHRPRLFQIFFAFNFFYSMFARRRGGAEPVEGEHARVGGADAAAARQLHRDARRSTAARTSTARRVKEGCRTGCRRVDPQGRSTERQILVHSAALLVAGLVPAVIGVAGPIYFWVALGLGAGLLGFSTDAAVRPTKEAVRRLLFATLVYLPVLLGAMALDKIS